MVYWIAATGLVLFVVVLLLDGLTRPGYSPARHPVSALALGSRGWIQTANFVLCGAAVTGGALGLIFSAGQLLLGIALSLFGMGLVASGVFRMDPMRSYPPGTPPGDPEHFTTRHLLHDYAGAVVFFGLPVVAVVAAFVMPGVVWTLLSAVAAAGLIFCADAFGKAWERDAAKTGLIQRSFIVPGWLWAAGVFTHFALAS